MDKPIIKSIKRQKKRAAEIHKLTENYKRFDQRKTVFGRGYREEYLRRKEEARQNHIRNGDEGYSVVDYSFQNSAFTTARLSGSLYGAMNSGFYSWDPLIEKKTIREKFQSDPCGAAQIVKKAALHYGADLVGITLLDRSWVYSHDHMGRRITFEEGEWQITDKKIVIPSSHEYVIVLGVEMSWDLIRYSPAPSDASSELGYSRMAALSGSLAEFLRELGWHAIPCGNDTALSVPLAIDAGLGQQGRHGRLITPKFGPRIRLCKVLTDMPMTQDPPIDFGVFEYCERCSICADECPAGAIAKGPKTFKGPSESNNNGTVKWYSNPDKCLRYWGQNGTSCAVCLKVCPYSSSGEESKSVGHIGDFWKV